MKGYTTIEQIENYLLTDIDLGFYDQIEDWIAMAEDYIEKETGRVFVADETASVKLYDGNGEGVLFIDDAVEITSVKINGEEVKFYPYPVNKTPITKIAVAGKFTKGKQNISVEARWGYSETVPHSIRQVATILVAGMIEKGLSSKGELRSVSLGQYSATFESGIRSRERQTFESVIKDKERQTFDMLKRFKRYSLTNI
jgi:hypothetical protein